MSKYSIIIGLGILIALMPFLGFPPIVKDIFFVIMGLAVAVIAYFSNIQYCNNCNQLVENGKRGVAGTGKPQPVGMEFKNTAKKDISDISPSELK